MLGLRVKFYVCVSRHKYFHTLCEKSKCFQVELGVKDLSSNQSVFKDESKLDINWVPPKLPHREKELRLLMEFFSFLLRHPEKMAQRVIITGEVGTGKTALSQSFGANITSEARKRAIKLLYVHVNCRECRGKLFLILQHILSIVRPNFPKRGYSVEEALDTLMQSLDEENAFS